MKSFEEWRIAAEGLASARQHLELVKASRNSGTDTNLLHELRLSSHVIHPSTGDHARRNTSAAFNSAFDAIVRKHFVEIGEKALLEIAADLECSRQGAIAECSAMALELHKCESPVTAALSKEATAAPDTGGVLPSVGSRFVTAEHLEMPSSAWLLTTSVLSKRKACARGRFEGYVEGHGGDLWWIRHEDGVAAPYKPAELVAIRGGGA